MKNPTFFVGGGGGGGGLMKNQYRGENCLKRGGLDSFANSGGLGKKERVVF